VTLVVAGRLALGTAVPRDLLAFALVFLLGTAALMAIGLLIAAVAPSGKTASIIGSVTLWPLMFLAGMWMPREIMPGLLGTISDYSVVGPFTQALRDAWLGQPPEIGALAVVAAGLVLFAGLAVRLFRWE
jgi:ABC-2 type transport system permease protein